MRLDPVVEQIIRDETSKASAERIIQRVEAITPEQEFKALVAELMTRTELLEAGGTDSEDPLMEEIRLSLRQKLHKAGVLPADFPARGPLCVGGYSKPPA